MKKKHILHLVTKLPEKYNSKFVEFSEENLTQFEHTYVCLVSGSMAEQDKTFSGANIIDLNDTGRIKKWLLLKQLFLSNKYDLVIFHGLFYTGIFLFYLSLLFRFSRLSEKALWMTWGGDIYYFQNRAKNLAGTVNEYLRKSIIKRLFFISSLIPEECELIRVNYGSKAVHLDAFYPNPTSYESVKWLPEKDETNKPFSFLLGNSADPQNNHIEMLNALGHLKDSIKVYCILSYAIVDAGYVEDVKALGCRLFGDNFIAVTDFMTPEQYRSFIEEIDFACYYHNRQQAMGNIFQFLYMGKAVFLRQDTLSCLFLQQHKLPVQDSEFLAELTPEGLTQLKSQSDSNLTVNQEIIQRYFSEPAAAVKWQNMLKRIFSLLKKDS